MMMLIIVSYKIKANLDCLLSALATLELVSFQESDFDTESYPSCEIDGSCFSTGFLFLRLNQISFFDGPDMDDIRIVKVLTNALFVADESWTWARQS
jgi:hypothetical protein